ncbi:hypothetical protein ACKWTF_016371 [Chironomus riparius]
MEKMQPALATGDLGGGYTVPKLEPLFIKYMDFGESGGVRIQLHDANIYGCSKFKLDKLRVNMKDLKFDALVSLPPFQVISKYQMEFNFFGTRLKSTGDYFAEHAGAKIIMPIRGHRTVKNGVEVVKFDKIALKFDRGKITQLKISNLFGGNKSIEEIINALVLNNQDFALQNVNPQMEIRLSEIFTEIANKVVANASFDDIFPL